MDARLRNRIFVQFDQESKLIVPWNFASLTALQLNEPIVAETAPH